MVRYQNCGCTCCGAAIRFEISRAGELVNCESCGLETLLVVPGLDQPYPEEEYFLQATNIGWSRSPLGFRIVVGTVMNTSGRDLDWVRIEFTLVNRDAMPVGSTSDCLIGFPAKGLWQFHAPVFQTDALGVGAPLISCEYGKIASQRTSNERRAGEQNLSPASVDGSRKLASATTKPAIPAPQWTGLRITGGITGSPHRSASGTAIVAPGTKP